MILQWVCNLCGWTWILGAFFSCTYNNGLIIQNVRVMWGCWWTLSPSMCDGCARGDISWTRFLRILTTPPRANIGRLQQYVAYSARWREHNGTLNARYSCYMYSTLTGDHEFGYNRVNITWHFGRSEQDSTRVVWLRKNYDSSFINLCNLCANGIWIRIYSFYSDV